MKNSLETKQDLQKKVMRAAQDNAISSILFRNALGSKLGLNITDSACFNFLAIKGVSTPTELAHYTGLTSGSTTTMLDRLEKAKLVKRSPNPNDRRGVLVKIDEHSKAAFGPLVASVQKAHQELIASYSQEELKTVADFLTRFTKNVANQTKLLEE
jgi:DNA-binding MarR family transcriptional regulator